MKVWVYQNSNDEIFLFQTKTGAINAFRQEILNYLWDEDDVKFATERMEEDGWFGDSQVYIMEVRE